MKLSNLLTRRRTVWTSVLLVTLLLASLTGAIPGKLLLLTSIASSLAHANSAPAYATSPKQEQEQSQQLEPGQPGQPATPLERVLNKDGTLNLSTGFSGSVSVDPKGWRMQTGPDGKPRFLRVSTNEQSNTQSSKLKTQNLLAPLAPGDENWDDRFGTLGMSSDVNAIAITGTDVYAVGYFGTAGGVPANGVAKWDGSNWSALGSGVSQIPYAIGVSGSEVYVGGYLDTAGGVPVNNIARWNATTSSWSSPGSGVTSGGTHIVFAIATSGSDVYVGGYFHTAGGLPAQGIAKWNTTTSSWSGFGSGVGAAYAIGISGNDVYVGGQFSTAGGVPANNIAKWNGSSWSALGSGVSNGGTCCAYVYAIAINGSDVYVGGDFTTAGGVPANHIAKWNGSTWSALGSGVNNYVNAIATSGSDVYAGGAFGTAGGVPVNNIAKWNGSSWSALGSGVNGGVSTVAITGTDVYVGGQFTTAGVNLSNNFGIWHIPPAANLVGHVSWAGSTQPDTRQMQPLTLTLCSTSGGPTSTYVANTNASGYFTVDVASLISGTTSTYNWREKGARTLANSGTLTLSGGNQQEEMGVQGGGDADNDNVVGVLDFQVLRNTFNSTTDLRADFNNDGVVSSQDFAILKVYFGQAGAPVACP